MEREWGLGTDSEPAVTVAVRPARAEAVRVAIFNFLIYNQNFCMINFQAKLRKTGLRDPPAQNLNPNEDISKEAVNCSRNDEDAAKYRPRSPAVIETCRGAGAENLVDLLADKAGLIQPHQPCHTLLRV